VSPALKNKAAAKQMVIIAICLFKCIFVNLQYFPEYIFPKNHINRNIAIN
jgi:hypothetical protein